MLATLLAQCDVGQAAAELKRIVSNRRDIVGNHDSGQTKAQWERKIRYIGDALRDCDAGQEQEENASLPVTLSGILTLVRFVQPKKAAPPMLVTVFGIAMLVSFVHL
jgi:hypothetical protein